MNTKLNDSMSTPFEMTRKKMTDGKEFLCNSILDMSDYKDQGVGVTNLVFVDIEAQGL